MVLDLELGFATKGISPFPPQNLFPFDLSFPLLSVLNTVLFRYNCAGLNFGKVDVGRYTDVSTRYVPRTWADARSASLGLVCEDLQRALRTLQVQSEHVAADQAAPHPDPLPRRKGGDAEATDRQERPSRVVDLL